MIDEVRIHELQEQALRGARYQRLMDDEVFQEAISSQAERMQRLWWQARNDPAELAQLNQGRIGVRLVLDDIERGIAAGQAAAAELEILASQAAEEAKPAA